MCVLILHMADARMQAFQVASHQETSKFRFSRLQQSFCGAFRDAEVRSGGWHEEVCSVQGWWRPGRQAAHGSR